nr:RNA-directed DNA polymerase [Micromonospora tarapacensis]
MRAGKYRFSAYREFLQLKGAGRPPRVLSVPTARDRIALRALANCLGELFPQTRGTLPQKRVHQISEALKVGGFDSYIKMDVEDFYPSIRHDLIEEGLRTRVRKNEIIEAVLGAVKTSTVPVNRRSRTPNARGVPQGLAISNCLAELVMQRIDSQLADEDCFYVRYVDDILILCDHIDVDRISKLAVTLFGEIGLRVHEVSGVGGKSSSGDISAGFSYLGYTFNPLTISVRDQSVRNVENSIARVFTRYKYERNIRLLESRINTLITGCIYGGNPYGWLHYFRQMNDLTLLKRLDVFVGEMKRRSKVPAGFATKSFVRAHWAITHPCGKDRNYIPNYDVMDIGKMRDVLAAHLGEEEVAKIPDSGIGIAFRRLMGKLTVELEKDIGHLS